MHQVKSLKDEDSLVGHTSDSNSGSGTINYNAWESFKIQDIEELSRRKAKAGPKIVETKLVRQILDQIRSR